VAAVPVHKHHRWVMAISVLGAIVLVAVCSVTGWFIIDDEMEGPLGARTNASAGPKRDITTRTADPQPLTEAEVFPRKEIIAVANEPPYVIVKTQVSEDCKVAAADALGQLLIDKGCNQVVRATMKSPNGQYIITAGMFNLVDEASADAAHDLIQPTVNEQKGRFTGMHGGPGTEAIVRAPTHLGWNTRGHFLMYCVIARQNGQAFQATDQFPQLIIYDIVETYLKDGILQTRATTGPSPLPSAATDPSAKPSGS
jgi:hypothetical protein